MAPDVHDNSHRCHSCGDSVRVLDRFRDYSTTRGPMAEHVVTRCDSCGEQYLVHVAAQVLGGVR